MGCVYNVAWTAMGCYSSLAWEMMTDQVVHDLTAAIDKGDTDLRLPVFKWDTVEAAWGQIWEKDWEATATTTPRQCADALATYKHLAASPVFDEVTGLL